MSGALAGKLAFVTGGSRGIGRAIATRLARDGADIILTYARDADAGREVAEAIVRSGRQAISVHLDIGDTASIADLVRRLPEILSGRFQRQTCDILVNNAGIGARAPLLQTLEADLRRTLETNIVGTTLVTQTIAPMIAAGGRVITISSGLSRRPSSMFAAYSMSKAALDAFTVILASELAPRRITANALAPGWTATDINAEARADQMLVSQIASQTAFGRLGEVDDIADAAAMLAGPDSHWITGQYIEASGGFRLQ